MNAIKTKVASMAEKVSNSKAYKTAERIAVGAGASVMALGASISASAVDWGSTISAETAVGSIAENASDFIEPAIIIMCAVSGLRLGMKFLRGSAR